MLYTFPKLYSHKSFRLNRNLVYFFSKLRTVTAASTFVPFTDYFDSQFGAFLNSGKQQTLRTHFETFFNIFKALAPAEKAVIIKTFFDSQKISEIFNNVTINGNNLKLRALPAPIQDSAHVLFSYLYANTINSFGTLKNHYKILFDSAPSSICPFCGIEILNSPSLVRQDYDHMLLQSEYVFSNVNMENIVPAGTECNRIYKHDADVLYHLNNRTLFNSAYTRNFDIRISMIGSKPPQNLIDKGSWVLTITPDNDYTRQWDRVYKIRDRYIENVLHKFYSTWLKEFRDYLHIKSSLPITNTDLENEFVAQGLALQENPTSSQANIVKGAFYNFIASYNDAIYQAGLLSYINSK